MRRALRIIGWILIGITVLFVSTAAAAGEWHLLKGDAILAAVAFVAWLAGRG